LYGQEPAAYDFAAAQDRQCGRSLLV
jgi:hypothetical protein